ncbi:SlyX family protein [soil metagenome]
MPTDDLERRVVELETRLAFQEQALVQLSDALAATRLQYDRNHDRLRLAVEDLQHARGEASADPEHEPPPPHY